MSTARLIPETWELTGDDARRTLRDTGRRKLLADAFRRMRWSDGFSHARSLGYLVALAAIQGMIALVGLARAFGQGAISDGITRAVQGAAPGPVADLLTTAISQAEKDGASRNYIGLTFGLIGWLVTTTTAMGQLERGLNRLYGVEKDRPSFQKYGLAFLLTVSVGALLTIATALVGFGRSVSDSFNNSTLASAVSFAAWPVGLAIAMAAVALLFRWCPRRHQPGWSWLAFGGAVTVLLWGATTVALSLFLSHSGSFGETYGSLAGVVALLLWSMLSSMAVLFGAAVAAQLEAVRAEAAEPQDQSKIAESEPDAAPAQGRSPRPAVLAH